MIYLFGHNVQVTDERQCRRSALDHRELVHEARVDRQKHGFQNIDADYVLCMRCGMAISLELEKGMTVSAGQ